MSQEELQQKPTAAAGEPAAADNVDGDPPKPAAPMMCSSRLALAIIGCFGFMNLYALRVNMSVAIVCMVNSSALLEQNGESQSSAVTSNVSDHCAPSVQASTAYEGEFAWDKDTQGLILSSFFWGYIVTQIPGGYLSERFGGKRVYGYSMLTCAIATLLSPVAARTHPALLITLRVIKGLGQGVVFPAMHSLWAHWAPPLERSKLIGFTYAGAQIGNVITLPLSGVLCEYGFDGGWPSIFYILGGLGVVWFIAWMILVSDTPAQHPRISDRERQYIEGALGKETLKSLENRKSAEASTPWLTFFTSTACWAIFVGHTFANWETYTLLTNIPTYMKEVLKLDIKANGLYSAIPYIGYWLFINVSGNIADFLRRSYMSTKNVRKMFMVLAMIVSGSFLVGTGYVTCDHSTTAIVLLALAVTFSGCQYAGFVPNHVDIAPKYAGVLFGISNTFATLSGIFAPYAIGKLTHNSTQSEWQTVFYLAAAICISGAIFFAVFAQGEIQPWAKDDDEQDGGHSEEDGSPQQKLNESNL